MTLKKIFLTLTIFIFMIFSGCGNNFKHISHDEAKKIIAENPDAIILDVRTQEEYDKKHIPKALLVPIDNLRAGDFSALPDKNKIILVYCRTGRRAEDSAKILTEHGYKNVYDFGGLVDWTGEVEGSEVE